LVLALSRLALSLCLTGSACLALRGSLAGSIGLSRSGVATSDSYGTTSARIARKIGFKHLPGSVAALDLRELRLDLLLPAGACDAA
jgi:hypothetical protein